jgi:hypothetical protein
MNEPALSKTALHWTADGKRMRGCPKETWQKTVEEADEGQWPVMENHPQKGRRSAAVSLSRGSIMFNVGTKRTNLTD